MCRLDFSKKLYTRTFKVARKCYGSAMMFHRNEPFANYRPSSIETALVDF